MKKYSFNLNNLDNNISDHEIRSSIVTNGIAVIESSDVLDFFNNSFNEIIEKSIDIAEGRYTSIYKYRCVEGGIDGGMIDVENAHQLLARTEYLTLQKILDKLERIIEPIFPKKISIENLRMYINRNVINTRGPHVDSISKSLRAPIQYKIFIYMTNVGKNDGPYSYCIGSNKLVLLKLINLFCNLVYKHRNKRFRGCLTDMWMFRESKMTSILGKKGNIIISDQLGVHCGVPQHSSNIRSVLVINII